MITTTTQHPTGESSRTIDFSHLFPGIFNLHPPPSSGLAVSGSGQEWSITGSCEVCIFLQIDCCKMSVYVRSDSCGAVYANISLIDDISENYYWADSGSLFWLDCSLCKYRWWQAGLHTARDNTGRVSRTFGLGSNLLGSSLLARPCQSV